MAYKLTRMETVQQIITLHSQGEGVKKIARILGVSRNTVRKYLRLWAEWSTSSQDTVDITDLYSDSQSHLELKKHQALEAQFGLMITELKRVGVTRYLLWEEYRNKHPDGYSYSRFCAKLKAYMARLDVTIRFTHKYGDVLSVDYTGKKLHWVDQRTGEVHHCEVLVCTLPASGYTYAVALASQKQEDFVHGINLALQYFGGLPQIVQSDNLKSFVIKSDRYEPTFNELALQLAKYYGIELQAARSGKPKDKAHVERHVAIVYHQIYGPLRDEQYHSIEALNRAIRARLQILNEKNYQGKSHSRKDLYEQERASLRPLPQQLFEIQRSTRAKVQRNYHVVLGQDKHQYSVPYHHVGKHTEVIYNSRQVEIYHGVERIALHKRDRRPHGYTTDPAHMPQQHSRYLEQKGWDAKYFKRQAQQVGPDTLWAVSKILDSKSFVEQTYRTCLGILSLRKKYGSQRLEQASKRARVTGRVNYQILSNILKNQMDKAPILSHPTLFAVPRHDNIRGPDEYT